MHSCKKHKKKKKNIRSHVHINQDLFLFSSNKNVSQFVSSNDLGFHYILQYYTFLYFHNVLLMDPVSSKLFTFTKMFVGQTLLRVRPTTVRGASGLPSRLTCGTHWSDVRRASVTGQMWGRPTHPPHCSWTNA